MALPYVVMRKLIYILIFCSLIIGCEHIRKIYSERTSKDSTEQIDYEWADDSPIDSNIIDRIYNANRMEDIFPSN